MFPAYVTDPDQFHLQVDGPSHSEPLEDLQKTMKLFYNSVSISWLLYLPKPGALLA